MERLKALFTKYMDSSCTVAEIELLMQYFVELKNEKELREAIAAELRKEPDEQIDDTALDNHLLKLYDQLKVKVKPIEETEIIFLPMGRYFRYAGVAAALVFVFIILYFFAKQKQDSFHSNLTAQRHGNDVDLGRNKAILTLADGSKISLTDAANGKLINRDGITITKTKEGELLCQVLNAPVFVNNQNQYNTVSTPAGGQFQITLSDGSKIWLNAKSSLKYPVRFGQTDRKVFLIGEAYFEIAKDQTRPFVVSTNGAGGGQEVKVLGTHFNINSYADEEATKTALIEGRVKITSGTASKILKPGQEAVVAADDILVNEVDVNQVIDWKNGNFCYRDESIYSVMRKLARWYDVDVIYEGKVTDLRFGGEISKTKRLSEVLQVLETAGQIHFKIKGKRVTVMQ